MSVLLTTAAVSYFLASLLLAAGLRLAMKRFRSARKLFEEQEKGLPDTAIVVTARNEEKHLPALLRALDAQDYPVGSLQIVVVNDGSRDDTALLMDAFVPVRHPFQMIHIDDDGHEKPSKKRAVSTGIASTTTPLLLLTDGDTVPPPGWASSMAAALGGGCPVVAGYSPSRSAGGITGWLARMWDLHSASLAGGFIGLGITLHITGRNWGFRKELFDISGGFSGMEEILSGDDTLLAQKFARYSSAKSWGFTLALHDQVPTGAPRSLIDFIRQKQRHLATAKRFRPAQFSVALLSFLVFSVFWLGLLILPARIQFSTALAALSLKIAADTILLLYAGRCSGEIGLALYTPVWSMVHLFLYPLFQLLATFVPFRWKGRRGI